MTGSGSVGFASVHSCGMKMKPDVGVRREAGGIPEKLCLTVRIAAARLGLKDAIPPNVSYSPLDLDPFETRYKI